MWFGLTGLSSKMVENLLLKAQPIAIAFIVILYKFLILIANGIISPEIKTNNKDNKYINLNAISLRTEQTSFIIVNEKHQWSEKLKTKQFF